MDSTGSVGEFASLAVDSNNRPRISYYYRTDGDLKFASYNGSGWAIDTVDSDGNAGQFTSLTLDSNDYPHISYFSTNSTSDKIMYASYNGTAWSKNIIDSFAIGWGTSLVLDSSNKPHLSYSAWAINNYLKYASDNGTGWSNESVDSTDNVGLYNSLALDSSNLPHISYFSTNSTIDKIMYASYNGTAWSTDNVVSGNAIGYTSLALDSYDFPRISYSGGMNDLRYASYNGTAWLVETVDSVGDVGLYTSLELDDLGYPQISYYDDSNRQLKYARWDGIRWQIMTVDSTDNVGEYTSLALDSVGNPCISYRDNANNNLKFAYLGYTLTMTVGGSGSVTPLVGDHGCRLGAVVNITATPASGWQFVNWTGGVANANSSTTTVTMNGDKTIKANFSQIPAPAPSGGGGGGGGGGVEGLTFLIDKVSTSGKLMENVIAEGPGRLVSLTLPKGTFVNSKTGSLVSSISIKAFPEGQNPPEAPAGSRFVGTIYDINPGGTTFNPPVTLTFKYDVSQLPEGVSENKLFLATYDALNGGWARLETALDAENSAVRTTINHLSLFAMVTGLHPAQININNLTITPAELNEEEGIAISVIVTNSGDLAGNYDITLKINDVIKEIKQIKLNGGASETISFDITPVTTGKYTVEINGLVGIFIVKTVKAPEPEPPPAPMPASAPAPASFDVSNLSITPGEARPFEKVTISALVKNTGGSDGICDIVLKINDAEEDKKPIRLGAGETERVTFIILREALGSYKVDINSLVGQFSIALLPPLAKPIESLPVQLATNWWLIGGIIAGCFAVSILLIYFFVWRKRSTPG